MAYVASKLKNHCAKGPDNINGELLKYGEILLHSDTSGSTFVLDYKGKWTDASDKPTKPFQGYLYTFTAVDSNTGFVFGKLAKSRLSIIYNLEALRLSIVKYEKLFEQMMNSSRTFRI